MATATGVFHTTYRKDLALRHTRAEYVRLGLLVAVAVWLPFGLSTYWLQNSDMSVRIPMAGQADSLNVAMATIITLFEAVRQRSTA